MNNRLLDEIDMCARQLCIETAFIAPIANKSRDPRRSGDPVLAESAEAIGHLLYPLRYRTSDAFTIAFYAFCLAPICKRWIILHVLEVLLVQICKLNQFSLSHVDLHSVPHVSFTPKTMKYADQDT